MSTARSVEGRNHAWAAYAILVFALVAAVLVPPVTSAAWARSSPWTARASLLTPRAFHTATLLHNGRLLVTGGVSVVSETEFVPTDSAELYTPWTNTWATVPPMSIPREKHTATLLRSGKVLVAGGGTSSGATSSAEIYTPWTNTWTTVAPMHFTRSDATATRLWNGKVLVVGDEGLGEGAEFPEIYTPWTNTWTLAAAMPSGSGRCGGATADLLGSGRVLITGGCGSFGGTTNESLEYDPFSNTWLGSARGPYSEEHTSTKRADGSILVTGGTSVNAPDAYTGVMIYDPSSAAWSSVSSMNIGRSGHVAAGLSDGRVLVAGGINNDGTAGSSAELYSAGSNSWTVVGSMGSPRIGGASATRLLSGRVLVVGGLSGVFGRTLNSAEVFDPATA